MNENYLITTDNWFYAPDGKKYRAAWGKVEILQDNILGIKTNRNSSNWFVKIGSDEKHIIIAGCQIHYAVKSDERPNNTRVSETLYSENGVQKIERENEIYQAQ